MGAEYHGRSKDCTATTVGTIVRLRRGSGATAAIVQYTVDGQTYEISEVIMRKCRWIKLGFLPIGQVWEPVMGAAGVGNKVELAYNPNDPQVAYIPKNVGFWT